MSSTWSVDVIKPVASLHGPISVQRCCQQTVTHVALTFYIKEKDGRQGIRSQFEC